MWVSARECYKSGADVLNECIVRAFAFHTSHNRVKSTYLQTRAIHSASLAGKATPRRLPHPMGRLIFCCTERVWLCVCVCADFQRVFGAGTPVASFSVAKREPAFRLLFNKPADRAYWLWMDRDAHWERHRERGREGPMKRREGKDAQIKKSAQKWGNTGRSAAVCATGERIKWFALWLVVS